MGQFEVNFKGESQQSVVVELAVKRVVGATHLEVLRLALLEHKDVDHRACNDQSQKRVDTKSLSQIVLFVNKGRVSFNIGSELLVIVVTVDCDFKDVPNNVGLKAARD